LGEFLEKKSAGHGDYGNVFLTESAFFRPEIVENSHVNGEITDFLYKKC
jgi:hypothetical protein